MNSVRSRIIAAAVGLWAFAHCAVALSTPIGDKAVLPVPTDREAAPAPPNDDSGALSATSDDEAAPSTSTDDNDLKMKAQSYFSSGEALFESGKFLEAAKVFRLAYETLPHFAVLANIGLAYESADEFPKAVEYFRKYLREAESAGKDNLQIRNLLNETLAKVSEIDVTADCGPAPCRIYIDQEDRGIQPVHAVLAPGEHEIAATFHNQTPLIQKFVIGAGERKVFRLTAVTTPEKLSDRKTPKPRMRIPLWIAAASTVAAGTASGILWGGTFKTKKDFDRADSIEEKRELKSKGERLQIGASVTAGIAGAAALTAVILVAVQIASSRADRKNAASPKVSCNPLGVRIQF